jgi:hypothetical protein
MRFFLRRAGSVVAAGFVIFCWSCERHQVGELPAEGKMETAGDTHAPEPQASPSPATRATSANFFPDKPKP